MPQGTAQIQCGAFLDGIYPIVTEMGGLVLKVQEGTGIWHPEWGWRKSSKFYTDISHQGLCTQVKIKSNLQKAYDSNHLAILF